MKNLAIVGALALALSGCAAAQKVVTFIDQPDVQQAAATIKTVGTALVCTVASTSATALGAEVQTGAHTSATRDVYVASSIPCNALSGKLTGAKAANVPAVTAVAPAQ